MLINLAVVEGSPVLEREANGWEFVVVERRGMTRIYQRDLSGKVKYELPLGVPGVSRRWWVRCG